MKHNAIHRLLLLILLTSSAQAQETLLRWYNGDVLSGTLLESESGQICWSSPIFADDLVVNTNALDSIEFPVQATPAAEAFRVGTVTGDVFTADLVGSSDEAFLFASQRYGRVQVGRDAVYSLQRVDNANLVFDGSQFGQWQLLMDGPIRHLSTRVYRGDWTWGASFPDLASLTPVDEARFSAGYLDLGLSRFQGRFAMSFKGDIRVPATGQYRFEGSVDDEAHLWIDGTKIRNDAEIARRYRAVVTLAQGSHSLRLDYIDLGGEAHLSLWMVNAREEYTSLAESNPTSGWQQGVGGHAQTFRKKASLFRAVELPDSFAIDLELSSSQVPQFVLAIGKDRDSVDSKQSLRLETWDNELVVMQGKVFEPVMSLEEHVRDLRLRLAFDRDSRRFQVFDASGILLASVPDVEAATGQSGITLRNRGEDLAVHRLGIYRQLDPDAGQAFDAAGVRVHLINGQVVCGRLYAAGQAAHVMDEAGMRHDIDLEQVDRIARPGTQLEVAEHVTELSYADGAVLRGRVVRIRPDQVALRTGFTSEPVICTLAGASLLRFDSHAAEVFAPGDDMDELFTAAGRLRGRLSFDLAGSPLSWHVPGAAKPLRLATGVAARIQRSQPVAKGAALAVDTDRFPCVLHLTNGEVMPCQILSYDRQTLGFESPFVIQRTLDAQFIKAIEFSPLKRQEDELGVDAAKLQRALTVPRFNRNSPPTHILMARNGDLKRGSLLGISTRSVQFQSKLRKQTIPIERMACVVNVSESPREPNESPGTLNDVTGWVRARLADGSILIFEARKSSDGRLFGHSAIYGDVAIPCDIIQELSFGGFEGMSLRPLFDGWVVRPAEEPAF